MYLFKLFPVSFLSAILFLYLIKRYEKKGRTFYAVFFIGPKSDFHFTWQTTGTHPLFIFLRLRTKVPASPGICWNPAVRILHLFRSVIFPGITIWHPWDCPAVFPKGDPFTGGADAYIHQLTEQILPEAERRIGSEPVWRGIAGYSLAGLFAIYTLYHTDLFSRAASMSGSLWFPGFSEYMESHSLAVRPDCIYLSPRKKRAQNKKSSHENSRTSYGKGLLLVSVTEHSRNL